MQQTLTHLTPVSGNSKTGPIPVSTSTRLQCAPDCPFDGAGCYAQQGPLLLHWRAVTEGTRGMPWSLFLLAIEHLPDGQLWRHNQAGDILNPNTPEGRDQLLQLAKASSGKRGWTYTHHKLKTDMAHIAILKSNFLGFTVNISCEQEIKADLRIREGHYAIITVPSTETRKSWKTTDGNKVLVCPAQTSANVTCATCGLCQKRDREMIIAFRAHGTQKRKADAALAA